MIVAFGRAALASLLLVGPFGATPASAQSSGTPAQRSTADASVTPSPTDGLPALSLLAVRNTGAGVELDVAPFVNGRDCAVTTRLRIDPTSHNAAVAAGAARAAFATKTPVHVTVTSCSSDGVPLITSVWMTPVSGGAE